MSTLNYFQRYESKENWVTNSTLLLLSRLYHYNRLKFEAVFNSILVDSNLSLDIGVNFTQQEKGLGSIPDGYIIQNSFKIVIETKLFNNFSIKQLENHLKCFNNVHSQKILLALSKNLIDKNTRSQIIRILKADKYNDIKFASTTFADIAQIISENLSDYDLEMREILDDYILLCQEHNLTNEENKTMLAFTAGTSINENLKFGIYYDPVTRNHNIPFKYIGLYDRKSIVAVGEYVKTICCDYKNGELLATNGDTLKSLTNIEYMNCTHKIRHKDNQLYGYY